jgi:hypothetical protein
MLVLERAVVLAVTLILPVLLSPALAQQSDLKSKMVACQKIKTEQLIAAKSVDFATGELGPTCSVGTRTWRGCNRDIQHTAATYSPPPGFVIQEAHHAVASQTSRSGIGSFSYAEGRATIPLSCDGNGCGGGGRVWVKVVISGRLRYLPTVEDTKTVTDACLDEVLK